MIAILLFFLLWYQPPPDRCTITLYVNGEQLEGWVQVEEFQLDQDYELMYLLYHDADDDNGFYFNRIDKPSNTYLDEYGQFQSQVGTITETVHFDSSTTIHDIKARVFVFDTVQTNKIILTCQNRFNLFVPQRVYLPVVVK